MWHRLRRCGWSRYWGGGPAAVTGLATGAPHGMGTGDRGAAVVVIAPAQGRLQPGARSEVVTAASLKKPPVLTYVPSTAYTEEAKRLHVEGEVKLSIRFPANGGIEVLGVTKGLGHGLDEVAEQAAKRIRFRPATDDQGHALDYTTVVTVRFQQI